MARSRRIAVWSGLGGVVVVLAVVTATVGWRPLIGPAARRLTGCRFELTPARLARGQYLFTAAAAWIGCHSEWDRMQGVTRWR